MEFSGGWKKWKAGDGSICPFPWWWRVWNRLREYFFPKPVRLMSADRWFVLHLGATARGPIVPYKREL